MSEQKYVLVPLNDFKEQFRESITEDFVKNKINSFTIDDISGEIKYPEKNTYVGLNGIDTFIYLISTKSSVITITDEDLEWLKDKGLQNDSSF